MEEIKLNSLSQFYYSFHHYRLDSRKAFPVNERGIQITFRKFLNDLFSGQLDKCYYSTGNFLYEESAPFHLDMKLKKSLNRILRDVSQKHGFEISNPNNNGSDSNIPNTKNEKTKVKDFFYILSKIDCLEFSKKKNTPITQKSVRDLCDEHLEKLGGSQKKYISRYDEFIKQKQNLKEINKFTYL